ncbi:MAG: YceI family protein [Tatlockia sp.]|jgi:polyisoprenoid-binding protein YceI
MKLNFARLFFLLTFVSSAHAALLRLDANASFMEWNIESAKIKSLAGKWPVQGTIRVNPDHPQDLQADLAITNSISGIPELRKSRKTPLFDSLSYPLITFIGKSVERIDGRNAKIQGEFSLHGVTRPVIFEVQVIKMEKNPQTHALRVAFIAKATIKRTDFGMKTVLPGVGDEIELAFNALASTSPN